MSTRGSFSQLFAGHYLDSVVQRRFIGSDFVRRGPLLSVGSFLFESGAMLGHAFRDRLDIFAIPFGLEGGQPDYFIRMEGQKAGILAGGADTLYELAIHHEMMKDEFAGDVPSWAEWLTEHGAEKLRIEPAWKMAALFVIKGAGFGAEFPQRLEDLYLASYGHVDSESWSEAYEHGVVDSPEPPEFVPFDTRRQEPVEAFAEFCTEYYPELLSPLGLAESS